MGALSIGSLIWSFITGNFTSVLGVVLQYVEKKRDDALAMHQTDVAAGQAVAVEMVRGEIEQGKIQAAVIAADRGWWATRWMKPAIFYPCAAHFSAVIADSAPWFGHVIGSWEIAKLPAPMDQWEGAILLSVVIVTGFKSGAGVLAQAIGRK